MNKSIIGTLVFVLCLILFHFDRVVSETPEQEEEKAIRQVIENYYHAWNRHDTKTLASIYAHDGDLRSPWNEFGKNRTEIEAIYASEHAKQMKEAHLEQGIKSIRMVKPDIAFIDVESVMTAGPAHGSAKRHYYVVFLLVKREGEWRILSGRPF